MTLVAPWLQSGSQAKKGAILSHIGVCFRRTLMRFLFDFVVHNVISLFGFLVTSNRIFDEGL